MAGFQGPAGKPLPMVAPVAKQQGKLVADNAKRFLAGKNLRTFRYRDWGIMATIGRASAVTRTGPLSFTGFTAWVAWVFVHLLMLIGFRSRLGVFINWAWDYLFFERAVRLIIPCSNPRCTAEGNSELSAGGKRTDGN